MLATAAVGVALAAAGCGGSDEYPEEAEAAFMTNCVAQSGATAESCRCFFDGLEERLSYDEFKKIDTAFLTGQQAPEEIRDKFLEAISDCR